MGVSDIRETLFVLGLEPAYLPGFLPSSPILLIPWDTLARLVLHF